MNAVAVTPDGQRIVSGGSDHTVRVWNLAMVHRITELARWVTDMMGVDCCAAHPHDPRRLVYGDDGGRVHVLSLHLPEQ